MIGYFTTKPTQGAAFKRLRDQFMGFKEAQDPGPGNPKKDCEYKVSKNGKKNARNVAPDHK